MSRVLITRPAEDSAELAAELGALGIDSLIAPMITIAPRAGAGLDLAGAQGLLVTSANGVRAAAGLTGRRDLDVYAVGPASAAAARELGFTRVRTAGGDVASLAHLVAAAADPAAGRLVHAAGTEVAGDLAGLLAAAGFRVTRAVLYEAVAATRLPDAVHDALARGGLDAILFFSPRTARTFVTLAAAAGLLPACASVTALCLSRAVADAAASCPWRAVRIAARPDRGALVALLDRGSPAANSDGTDADRKGCEG